MGGSANLWKTSVRHVRSSNASERQRRAHEQKINATALLTLSFKRSGTPHKRPAASTLYSDKGGRYISYYRIHHRKNPDRVCDQGATGMAHLQASRRTE